MNKTALVFLAAISLSPLNFAISAQEPAAQATESKTEVDKAKQELQKNALKLVDDAIGAANGLKLWENRALVFAVAGDAFWDSDQKRARSLFRDAANELTQGANQPKEKSKNYWDDYGWWDDVSPRRQILLFVAARDADLALQLMLDTRSPELQAAINAAATNAAPGANKTQVQTVNEQKNRFKAQEELQLEQNFAVKAAEQDPQKAAKLLRSTLNKGISTASIELVKKINKKDQDLGKELLGEILRKIADADFKTKDDARGVASYLIGQSFAPQRYKTQDAKFEPLKIEDADLSRMAQKYADYLLQKTDFSLFWEMSDKMPALLKYAPEKAALLRDKETALKKLFPEQQRGWIDANKIANDPNASAEKLLTEAEEFTGYEKFQLYRAAIDKSVDAGTADKTREALQNAASDKQREDALSYLDGKLSEKAIKDDKLAEAEKIVAKTESNKAKVRILVDLAAGFAKKNTKESRAAAQKFVDDARRLINDIPESREEANDILKVAAGYAVVEPARAFALLSPLVEMSNDTLTAYALLSKYNKNERTFKQGEMIFTQNLGGYTSYGKELGLLAASDFARTKNLVEQFRREDARTLAKLLLAQSILKDKIELEGSSNNYFFTDEDY